MENQVKKINLSDGLLLFLLPIYGYILLFAYEYGYFVRLGIPTEFIEINLAALAKICAYLFAGALIGLGFSEFIYKLILMGKGFIIKILSYLYLFFVLSILPTIAFDLHKFLLPFIIIGVLYLFSEFVSPLIKYKGIKGYWKKAEQMMKDEAKDYKKGIGDEIIKRIGSKPFRVVFYLLSFTYISFSIGAISAKTQENFLVLKSNPELVVLRNYSQKFLCVEYDRNKKKLLNKFSFLTIDKASENAYSIAKERIGPLSPNIYYK